MTSTTKDKVGETPAYWLHKVDAFPSPVAQFRMAQLIDLDERLYETARIVYRFLVGWYHSDHGDALLSQRHVAKVMKQRAPAGASVPSRNAVQRAIIALMETGWVVRTFQGRGKGRGASRYVPVINVLELAAQGRFPEPAHANGPAQLAHATGPVVAHANGPVESEPAHANGPKTHLPDPLKDARTGKVNLVTAAGGPDAEAPAATPGFERIWRAYGKHGNKLASRAAFAAVEEPDINHIAERAAAWAASAKPGQRRMPLEKWLDAEKYDEADRRVEPRPSRKQATPGVANDNKPAANDNKPASGAAAKQKDTLGLPARPAGVCASGRIVSTEVEKADGDTALVVHLSDGHSRRIVVEARSERKQIAGQAELQQLSAVAGDVIEDTTELHGINVMLVAYDDGTFRWKAAA